MTPDRGVLHQMTTSKACRDIDLQEPGFIGWLECEDDHTKCVGAPAFMSCGCGGRSLGSVPDLLSFFLSRRISWGLVSIIGLQTEDGKYSRFCGGMPSSLCLRLIWRFKPEILLNSRSLWGSLGVPSSEKRCKTYQSFAGQAQRSGFPIRLR